MLHWKYRALTTGPLEKSLEGLSIEVSSWEITEGIRRRLVDVIRPHVFAC